jgi:hypothetical protein
MAGPIAMAARLTSPSRGDPGTPRHRVQTQRSQDLALGGRALPFVTFAGPWLRMGAPPDVKFHNGDLANRGDGDCQRDNQLRRRVAGSDGASV